MRLRMMVLRVKNERKRADPVVDANSNGRRPLTARELRELRRS